MKKVKWIVLMAVAWLSYACQDEEAVTENGVVEFSFAPLSTSKNGRTAAIDLPAGTYLRISISRNDGSVVYTMKQLDLLKIGESYFSVPLAIPAGSYRVTDYLIVSPGNQVLYAAPHAGAPFAHLVTAPLPITFTIVDNETTNTSVEVINASLAQPEDFGYASFGVDIVPTTGFAISVFKPLPGTGFENTSAQAYIIHHNDTLVSKTANSNTVVYWENEPGEEYKLVVIKQGYARYEKVFTLETITPQLHGSPLIVILEKAFTFSIRPERAYDVVYLSMQAGYVQQVNIDWGDGITDVIAYPFDMEFRHQYRDDRKYFVSISGNIERIEKFSIANQVGIIDTISIVHLPLLSDFRMNLFQYTGKSIDFSASPELETLQLTYNQFGLSALDISHNPLLMSIDLQGTAFGTAAIDKFIDDLYASVVSQNRTAGFLNVWTTNPHDPGELIGPPSPDRFDKLVTLKNQYHWFVYPISQP